MSVDRKWFLLLILMFIYTSSVSSLRVILLPLLLWILFYKADLRMCGWFLLFATVSFFSHLPSVPNEFCGTITDIRENVSVIQIERQEYSLFDQDNLTLHDKICIEGTYEPNKNVSAFVTDPIRRWSSQRRHMGTIEIERLEIVKRGNTFKSFVFARVSRIDPSGWLKTFLFAHPAPIQGHFTMLFVSGGLIAGSVVTLLRRLSGFFFEESVRRWLITGMLIFACLIWGGSFVCVRLLVSDIVRYRKISSLARVSITYAVLLSLFPYHLTHPALIIPMTLSLIQVFDYPRFISRMAILPLIQTFLMYRFDFFSALLFPVFRIVGCVGYFFAWVCVAFPSMLKMFIAVFQWLSFDKIPLIHTFQLIGHPGILLTVFWIFFLFNRRRSDKQLIFRLCLLVLLFQMRFLINPWTTVTFFNVGQADSALIEFPFHQGSWLIDTGRKGSAALLRANLWYRGHSTISAVIISHNDSDHSGGEEMLNKDFTVKRWVVDNEDVVRYPFVLYGLMNTDDSADDNDNSLVHLFSVNGLSYLFLGDISKSREAELLRKYPFLDVDIVKLAHHGSKTSTSESLLATVRPRLAIISADPRVYGHPHKQTLRTLWQFQIPFLSTYQHGDIRISSLGNFHLIMSSSGGFGIMKTVIK